jgi:hypothetical protein
MSWTRPTGARALRRRATISFERPTRVTIRRTACRPLTDERSPPESARPTWGSLATRWRCSRGGPCLARFRASLRAPAGPAARAERALLRWETCGDEPGRALAFVLDAAIFRVVTCTGSGRARRSVSANSVRRNERYADERRADEKARPGRRVPAHHDCPHLRLGLSSYPYVSGSRRVHT